MKIDLNAKLFDLVKQDENLQQVLFDIGFKEVVKPGMLKTVGKIMTLNKGAKLRKIDINYIIKILKEKGYKVVGHDE